MIGIGTWRFLTYAICVFAITTTAMLCADNGDLVDDTALNAVMESAKNVNRTQKAFDTAEGFGAYSQGGRGGKQLFVTSLADNGQEGTLRWAIEQPFPRIVTFKVQGLIVLQSNLTITEPFITIDGSTAPGIGVTIKDGSLTVENTHDVIIRHLRVRPGDEVALKKGIWSKGGKGRSAPTDGISVKDSAYVMIDHCSASWTSDEALSVVRSDYTSVQWCFIYEPLANPDLHIEGNRKISHAYGCLVSGKHISYIKNLIGFIRRRGPQVAADMPGQIEVVNNYVCAYIDSGTRIKLSVDQLTLFHVINNSYDHNLTATAPEIDLIREKPEPDYPAKYKLTKVYLSGNIGALRRVASDDEWKGSTTSFTPMQTTSVKATAPLFKSNTTALPTDQVAKAILASAGATLPKRDSQDLRIVKQAQTDTGGTINSQDDVGGYAEFR